MFQKLKGTPYELSQDAANFLAGGLASNLYWLSALRAYFDDIAPLYPANSASHRTPSAADNVKSRIMTDSLARPRYRNAWHVVRVVFHEKDLPSRSRLGNTIAGMGNFYRVSLTADGARLVD